jgi:hypothetical protein
MPSKPIPTIACINESTIDLGIPLKQLVEVLQKFVDEHVAPIWGTPAKVIEAKAPVPADAWLIHFVDSPADPRVTDLGNHGVSNDCLPEAFVFVKPILAAHEAVSFIASHEVAEMLVNPADNLWVDGLDGRLYAYEVADPVTEDSFEIGGVPVSNFVHPAYFDACRAPGSTQFDHLSKMKRPFEQLANSFVEVRCGCQVLELRGGFIAPNSASPRPRRR